MRSGLLRLGILICAAVGLTGTQAAHGDPFTINNIAVVRVGDGTNALTTNAAAVSILEFTTAANQMTPVQILSFDSSNTPNGNAFTLSGIATSEGTLSAGSLNSAPYLTLAGYNKDAGDSNPSADASSVTNRVVARVGFDGTIDVSTKLNAAFNGTSVKGAATSDGNKLWVSGGAAGATGGLQYTTLGSSTTTDLASPTNNFRQVQVLNGKLFVGSADSLGGAVNKVGTGLPESGTPTLSAAIGPTPGRTYNSFFFTRLGTGGQATWSPGGDATGFDTLYAVHDATGVLEKWQFIPSGWVLADTETVGGGILNIAGVNYGANGIALYFTSSTELRGMLDTGGFFGLLPDSTTSTLLASAGSGFAFRGVAIVPEPGSLALCGLAGAGLVGFVLRRRKSQVVVN